MFITTCYYVFIFIRYLLDISTWACPLLLHTVIVTATNNDKKSGQNALKIKITNEIRIKHNYGAQAHQNYSN